VSALFHGLASSGSALQPQNEQVGGNRLEPRRVFFSDPNQPPGNQAGFSSDE
jgi:hypothetical protein